MIFDSTKEPTKSRFSSGTEQIVWINPRYLTKEWMRVYYSFLSIFILYGLFLLSKLSFHYFAPFGKSVTYNYSESIPGSTKFSKISETQDGLAIGGSIVSTKTSRFSVANDPKLSSIKVKIKAKSGQNEIKLGFRGLETKPFAYRSLYFAPLHSLDWTKTEGEGVVLYQKQNKYSSVKEFFTQIDKDSRIGTYDVDMSTNTTSITSEDYVNTPTILDTPIRGDVVAYILAKSGDIDIKIYKQDMNMYEGGDTLVATLKKGEQVVSELKLEDDGFSDASRLRTAPQSEILSARAVQGGIYKLELKFDSEGSDSYVAKLEINQKKVVFENSMLVWGSNPATLFTNAKNVEATTNWLESLQKLKIDNSGELDIASTKTKYTLDLTKSQSSESVPNIHKIEVPKGNINLSTDGYLFFANDAFFDPKPFNDKLIPKSAKTQEIEKNYDYVITSPSTSQIKEGWIISEIEIDPRNYNLSGERIYLSLEIPDLEKNGGSLEIEEFSITLSTK